jgi:imidazolonepropionase-like amidohydrolase
MGLSPIRRRLVSASLRCICAALGALITALPLPTAHAGAEVTALVGGTVIDGTGAEPLADAIVLIEGERIAAVGRSDAVAVPDGARVVDVRGKWIIPGLIDAHIHFFQSGGRGNGVSMAEASG